MAGIAYRYSGSVRSLTGAAYTNPTAGTYRLNVRTGSGSNDIMKFGFTTNTSASAYSPKMLINGNVCYIGRTEGGTASSTRSSSYVSEYRTASRASTSANSKKFSMSSFTFSVSGTKNKSYMARFDYHNDYYKDEYDEYWDRVTAMSIFRLYESIITAYDDDYVINCNSMYVTFKGNRNNSTMTTRVGCCFRTTQSLQDGNRYGFKLQSSHFPVNHNYTASKGYIWYPYPTLGDIARAVECDAYWETPLGYYGSATYNVVLPYASTIDYFTRSSRYTTATITATRQSTYTYANTTHNYNI